MKKLLLLLMIAGFFSLTACHQAKEKKTEAVTPKTETVVDTTKKVDTTKVDTNAAAKEVKDTTVKEKPEK